MTTIEAVKTIQKNHSINAILAYTVFNTLKTNKLPLEEAGSIIANKPKPFVKWVGGKRQLLKQFRELDLYPPDAFNPSVGRYFEPFVGGGAVFFDLLPKKAFLSDLNAELVTAYNTIKNDVEGLIASLKKYKYDKDFYLKIRSQEVSVLTELQIAARFIYLNRTGFNGLYRVNKGGKYNVPFGRYNNPLICDEVNLRKVSKALQNVEIKNQDYKAVLKQAKNGDFVYFDPPYYPVSKTASFTSYTNSEFLEKEQKELRDTFVELHNRGCFVMLSNSDTKFINDIYGELQSHGIRISKIKANRNINSNAAGRLRINEALVTNY